LLTFDRSSGFGTLCKNRRLAENKTMEVFVMKRAVAGRQLALSCRTGESFEAWLRWLLHTVATPERRRLREESFFRRFRPLTPPQPVLLLKQALE
jgi:hypothetical protein